MDDSPKKLQQQNSADNGSPIMIRRRLSVPETVMRKYVLAQQRPDSQNSEYSNMSESPSHWRANRTQGGTGSDSNLSSRKRDSDYMRKSTLLRRLWNYPKQYSDRNSRITGTYTEWYLNKLSSGKSTNSLSYHSSPEHSLHSRSNSNQSLSNFKTNSKRNMSPKHIVCDLNKNRKHADRIENEDIVNKNVSTPSSNNFSDMSSSADNQLATASSTIKTTTTETESERISTRSIGTSGTTYSDMSDKNCCKGKNDDTKKLPDTDSTNLNVISNVQLSQSTLNLIFTQVMHDVEQNDNVILDDDGPRIINVQQMPSFFLRQTAETNNNTKMEAQNKIIKYMISNVTMGNGTVVSVPRYSAQPKTTSMEVNTSSADSTDKDSDTMSLVDSLEDPTSPRVGLNALRAVNKHDCKPVRGDLSVLLPDNSDKKRISPNLIKSEAYFLPFQAEAEDKSKLKTVAELLPEKLRERLAKRQKRRQLKMQQSKSRSRDPKFEGDLDNAISLGNGDANFNRVAKPKTKQKKLLPSINNLAGFKIDGKGNINYADPVSEKKYRQIKRKALTKFPEPLREHGSKNVKTKHKQLPAGSKTLYHKIPEITTKSEYVYDAVPKRIYHTTEMNHAHKRIEILEIMECVEAMPEKYKNGPKNPNKSKIPVPIVQPKLPKLSPADDSPESPVSSQKPTFLDADDANSQSRITDPKIDQLIANILIDALHKPDIQSTLGISPDDDHKYVAKFSVSEIRPATVARFQQRFEVIPEEKSSSIEEDQKAVAEASGEDGLHQVQLYKGKEALAGVKDDNFTAIPKGWITFYMLRKSDVSPDNTSADEGTKRVESKSDKTTRCQQTRCKNTVREKPNKKQQNHIDYSARSLSPVNAGNGNKNVSSAAANAYVISQKKKSQPQQETTDSLSSTSDQENEAAGFQHPKRKEGHGSSRKAKYHHQNQCPPSGWSVTVSGTNTGHFAPELEMRFKFPHATQSNGPAASHSDSGLGEENLLDKARYVTNKSFEPTSFTQTDNVHTTTSAYNNNNSNNNINRTLNRLPDLVSPKNKKKTKRYDCSVPVTRSGIEPRQTRTSYRRYSLHHRSHPHFVQRRQYTETFRKFPQILTVRGNAVCPEKKPRVLTMTERDLCRNFR